MTALDERARLFAELGKVEEAGDLAARAYADATTELGGIERELGEVRMDHVRGNATDADVRAVEQRYSALCKLAAGAEQRQRDALEARRAIERDLSALYAEHLDEFAAEAEQLTQVAREKLEAVRGPYAAAYAAWSQAKARWRPLVPALAEQLEAAFTDIGQTPDRMLFARLAHVPDCPLQPENEVFGRGEVARPRGIGEDGTPDIGMGVLDGVAERR